LPTAPHGSPEPFRIKKNNNFKKMGSASEVPIYLAAAPAQQVIATKFIFYFSFSIQSFF
tara:strand:+ start:461 stop:637 length:177 start_codon:yes stop_codon:yes gene_type:complete